MNGQSLRGTWKFALEIFGTQPVQSYLMRLICLLLVVCWDSLILSVGFLSLASFQQLHLLKDHITSRIWSAMGLRGHLMNVE